MPPDLRSRGHKNIYYNFMVQYYRKTHFKLYTMQGQSDASGDEDTLDLTTVEKMKITGCIYNIMIRRH